MCYIKVMIRRLLLFVPSILLVIAISIVAGSYLSSNRILTIFPDKTTKETSSPSDKYTAFFFEIYDLINQNYWNKLSNDQLDTLVKLAIEKLTGQPLPVSSNTRQSIEKTLLGVTKDMSDERKNDFYPKLADLVLQNLEPFGRSRLYSAKETKDLSNTINNIEPGSDRYADLGLSKNATKQEIDNAYKTKLKDFENMPDSPDKVAKVATVEKAYATLKDTAAKKNYDESGVDSSVNYKVYGTRVLYINLTKFSPTSVQDMVGAADTNAQNTDLDTMILDLRGNIGGLIDGLPYLLGPFIGNDQYAYQFFNQGNKIDFKTKLGFIPSFANYTKILVLIDGQSQSSAEVFAETLKKYHVGVLVGQKTKGWGTVEKVTKLTNQLKADETYSVLLVENLTLRADGLPIEGNGVIPDIDTGKSGWEKELLSRFNFQDIVDITKQLIVLYRN